MEKKLKTTFIEFLDKEYLSSYFIAEDKNVLGETTCETSKLQKVLDIFIADEETKDKRIIDDVLIENWQKASQIQKTEILNSFLKKQRFKKKDLDEMLVLLNKNSNYLKRQSVVIMSDWKNVLFTICFLAFVLSALIVRLFPTTADKIIAFEDGIYNPSFLSEEIATEKSDFIKSITKDDLGDFIQKNSKYIVKPENDIPYSINVSSEEIKGRVAGVSEKNNAPVISDLENVKKLKIGFMESFVKKQVKLAETINQSLKNIFK